MSETVFNLYLLANSPGELSNWVKPIMLAFQKIKNVFESYFIPPNFPAPKIKKTDTGIAVTTVNKKIFND